ncbi:helix-turn-helix domain-containing protein [Novosphingobium soli]|uniref:Helix-turn-helix domain-containing protein n=1 Tax=Novosphingobium soli TaxID=574956 RepID=A0ABV6CVG4_9SPHN
MKDDLLHGAQAAADFLGITRNLVYKLADKGEIPVIRKGGAMFFRKSELEKSFSSSSDLGGMGDER